MGFKSFHIRVIIRVGLLTGSLVLTSYCLTQEFYLRSAYAVVLSCILVAELLYFIFRFTRNLTTFLQSIQERDFSIRFAEIPHDKIFAGLYSALNSLTILFRKISIEKEIKHRYLETLVSHVSFGVVSFDENGNVILVNQAFLVIAATSHLNTLGQLQRKNGKLFDAIQILEPGKKKLIQLPINNQLATLTLTASEFKLDDQLYKLISVQNITNELTATEVEAWQRLIKVLTHEIMNSISPIISLSGSLHALTEEKQHDEEWKTLHSGIDAIRTRSEGLLSFTQRYRKLTQVPPPEIKLVDITDFMDHIIQLVKPELDKRKIELATIIEPTTSSFDSTLLEQVILNLIQNAIDALENIKDPKIRITVTVGADRVSFIVHDNGTGIATEDLDKIFVPFYTTKKNGSGIGLALSQQIVTLHGGEISVQSEVGKGTTFIITLLQH